MGQARAASRMPGFFRQAPGIDAEQFQRCRQTFRCRQIENHCRAGTDSQPGILFEFFLDLPGCPTRITERYQDVVRIRARAVAECLQDILRGGQSDLIVNRKRRLPFAYRTVQHKPAVDLNRPAKVHRQSGKFVVGQFDFNLFEQCPQGHIRRPVDNYTQRALLIVLANESERLGKVGIDHVRHGDQEVVRQVYALHLLTRSILNPLSCRAKCQTRIIAGLTSQHARIWSEKPLATDQELSSFLANVERRAFKQAVFAVRDEHSALDIVQDAMLKLADRYSQRPAAELPLLFQRILQNTIRDFYRRQKVRSTWTTLFSSFQPQDESEDYDFLETLETDAGRACGPAEQLERAEVAKLIEQGLEMLPPRQRQAFLLRYWEELDVAETATAMGCSQGSVKTHCSRATHSIAEFLRTKGIAL